MSNTIRTLMTTAILLGAGLGQAHAQSASFYKGRTIELLIGFSPGGGYDAYGRALATVFGKHVPGNPTVVVKNMTGAGSMRLALYLSDAAPKDGTTIGIFDNGLKIAPLLKPELAKFDPSKLGWIGAASNDTQVCMVWAGTKIESLEEMKKREIPFGVTGLDDTRYMNTAMLRSVAGAKIKIIPGYPGSNDIRLAMERGEIEGVCDSWQSLNATKIEWIRDKRVNIVVQMTSKRINDLPNVPTIMEAALPNISKGALDLLTAMGEAGRAFATPPGVPSDRMEVLRRAFDKSVLDPEFLELAKKQQLELDPMKGEDVEKFIAKAYATAPKDVELARKMIE